jgi:glycosyltransferase involved in cell wall biosynthesis
MFVKMVKISFILPCYNVAPYVGRCIESIETQDIPKEEYEVICVDDCSKDNTAEVIEQYQTRFSNVRLVRHEVNQTAGGARNTGIREAKGEYLWFVDPDDAILPNVLKTISDKIAKSKVEILFFNYQMQKESGEVVESRYTLFDGELSGQEYVTKYLKGRLSTYCNIYSCVFKREFIQENDIEYPKLRAGQDVLFIWKSILSCKCCAIIDKVCYKYIRRSDSITGSKGKFTARAIMSHSLLSAYEFNNLLLQFPDIDSSIKKDLTNAIHCALNDESRKIMYADHANQRVFYTMFAEHKDKIDAMQTYMDRKTKNIFRGGIPYVLWRVMIKGYRVIGKVK